MILHDDDNLDLCPLGCYWDCEHRALEEPRFMTLRELARIVTKAAESSKPRVTYRDLKKVVVDDDGTEHVTEYPDDTSPLVPLLDGIDITGQQSADLLSNILKSRGLKP